MARRRTRRLEAGDLEEAVALYRGPFLDGFFLDGSEAFEEWATYERGRLAHQYEGALERLATDAESRGEPVTAARWWRALATARPSDGRIALRLIESNISLGDPVSALTHADVHARWLRDEHGVAPDSELTARVAALRRRLSEPASPTLAPPVMAGFELHLLGGAVLREGERTPLTGRVVHRHRLALLARLASAAPDSVSRDKLVGLL